jgi:HK97 family phage prohead protease
MKIKSVPVDPKRVKAGPEDGLEEGEFIVYPSTFIRKSDSYGDVVAKGAFLDDIEEWKASGNVLPGLYGHRMDDPDYFVAGASDEGEDDHGWWVRGKFDLENPKAKQVYRLVKGRRLNQLSFAYDVLDEGKVELNDGTTANELRKLKRYEFSFVPIGANQDTSVVAVKGIIDGLKAGRVLSAKNETALREARDAIDSVLSSLADEEDGKSATEGGTKDQEKGAQPTGPAKDEEPSGAKSEEPSPTSPADHYLAVISIAERN